LGISITKGAKECALLLAKATTDEQQKGIGNQTGGRVFFYFYILMILKKITSNFLTITLI
jgi:hypothetical protein